MKPIYYDEMPYILEWHYYDGVTKDNDYPTHIIIKKYIMNIKNYTAQTAKYIKTIDAYLIGKYGATKPEWEAIIMMLADNLDLYKKCKKSIDENGIYDASTGRKNPLLSTIKDLQATIIKQIQHLGLSPYAVTRLGKDEEEEDNFIENLIND